MKNSFFKDNVNSSIKECLKDNSTVVVLKGVPLDVLASDLNISDKINYDSLVANKLMYFSNNVSQNRRIYTYEEYLYLRDFFLSQYNSICIVENNIYMDVFPINNFFSSSVMHKMLLHFEDPEEVDEDVDISGIDPYISIFSGLKEYNGYIIGSYLLDISSDDVKVKECPLFEGSGTSFTEVNDVNEYFDIIEETDYINLIKKLYAEPDEIYISISNYTGDVYKLKSRLNILASCFGEWTDIYVYRELQKSASFEHREEYNQILQKYWGHASFRDIKIYNTNELEKGKKVIETISQEQIIANIVEQVENCYEGNGNYRDIFVTAPTGAGKSAMFQIPAIYLAEKYNLLTIVISPLIGLMNDQVKGLEVKNYNAAQTINSDISPIVKQDIISKVDDGTLDILYISPETLLSRSDVEQLIGSRTIGAVIIDEAHIVTTWGKGFRPDYWYLGDHIRKMRKKQEKKGHMPFVIATFTATAIYHGIEDMYSETVNSLHMVNPITYLGYVKRNDITVNIIRNKKNASVRSEHELDKFNDLTSLIKRSLIMNKKTLIYFPTVALIERCYKHMIGEKLYTNIARYYGPLDKDKKQEAFEQFSDGTKLIMFATKAFGMGIDIDNIEIVAHFAPTGNVCDYVQEIGRAARNPSIDGEAYYAYDSRDFRYINRMHGLSRIHKYQLIEVIKKIDEIYTNSLKSSSGKQFTRKRNALLLDAESFTYIFDKPFNEEDDNLNKVKTALLMIQKDFESRIGFSPINVRPIPLFAMGFFKIDKANQAKINRDFPNSLTVKEDSQDICQLNLERIWNKKYSETSFPQFKYLLYSKDPELGFNLKYNVSQVLWIKVDLDIESDSRFNRIMETLKAFVNTGIRTEKYYGVDDITEVLSKECSIAHYKARSIAEVMIAAMSQYALRFHHEATKVFKSNATDSGYTKYQFQNSMNSFFKWIERYYHKVLKENEKGTMYVVNDGGDDIKAISTVLGILESFNVLSFEMIGGENSQLYIYINQIQNLKNIINMPGSYENKLLENVAVRHLISVKMLTYLYENDFSSDETWNLLEDYFLGIIPAKVKSECKKENPKITFV
ncbi:ATP-dependent DNA helicase RecQ [Ruminococcaceae bacterium YRB3002]|nr:ATP-dependent DNA helicase RecQ [Ruminococcaceae bacterium YRB3002]